jgi:hypothetical protein
MIPKTANSPACWGSSELLKELIVTDKIKSIKPISRKYRSGNGLKGVLAFTEYEREWNMWAHVNYSELGCWEWRSRAPITPSNRPKISWGEKYLKVARISWMVTRGEIPEGIFVCHGCDNIACVRPDHLFLGTQQDNMMDMVKKGRFKPHLGENNTASRLKSSDVLRIREIHSAGGVYCTQIASQFNVSADTIRSIVRGTNWSWLK